MVALFICSLKLLLCLVVSGSRLIALFIGSLKLLLCLWFRDVHCPVKGKSDRGPGQPDAHI